MTKRMLIDATHAEETRVVVLDGNRLEDFDVETSTKRQLKGNIYLAKVVRVEPSLQAAFVEYGGNRHGFLAFSEIHPDYYQIPVADRQRLLEMEAEEARREAEEEDLELALSNAQPEPEQPVQRERERSGRRSGRRGDYRNAGQRERDGMDAAADAETREISRSASTEPTAEAWAHPQMPRLLATQVSDLDQRVPPVHDTAQAMAEAWASPANPALHQGEPAAEAEPAPIEPDHTTPVAASEAAAEAWATPVNPTLLSAAITLDSEAGPGENHHQLGSAQALAIPVERVTDESGSFDDDDTDDASVDDIEILPPPETVGGGEESADEPRERRLPPRFLRNYKIQEVIRRRQIMLVQVVKEERGTKGAALTTYLSLAGRFGVLMPNSPRGGGISRKITSAADRRRLKEVMAELDIPRGMGLIIRTAGAARPKPEIKRDCEYLLRLWDDIRDHTLKSVAPALIYEEASLIKRAIRDVYSRDIDEILVDGEDGWRAAHDFMRMLMPSHARKVQLWREGGQPLFARNQVEAQLDGMLMPTVQLRSGGYLVINQTEALVAIDVNSGRSTRERNIEETALRTNLEAADEVARQLRLRDLAGLIVIDFIDMESKRHNAMVEKRIKEALKNDRARIQVGHISHFGLLEMSRQRLRPSLAETSFIPCPHCGGTGHVRSTESAAIHVLRGIEDEGGKRRSAEITVYMATPIALYLLNHKRERLQEIEARYAMRVIIAADDTQISPQYRIEKVRTRAPEEAPPVVTAERAMALPSPVDDAFEEEEEETEVRDAEGEGETLESGAGEADSAGGAATDLETAGDDADHRRRKRRRRRRGGRRDDQAQSEGDGGFDHEADAEEEPTAAEHAQAGDEAEVTLPSETPVTPPETTGPKASDEGTTAAPHGDEVVAPRTGELFAESATAQADQAATAEDAAAEEARGRRRGRRGGRRRRRDTDGEMPPFAIPGAEQPEIKPAYAGPTPADPFGGRAFDIFDMMDEVERAAEAKTASRTPAPVEIANASAPEPVPSATKAEPEATEAAPAPQASEHPEPPAAPEAASMKPATAESPATAPATVASKAEQPSVAPEPAAAEAANQPDIINVGVVEPAAEPLASAQPAEGPPRDEPPADVAVAETPEQEPAIKPIVIGSDAEPPAEKKRGWWRR